MTDIMLQAMRGAAAVVDSFPEEYNAEWHSRAQISRGDWEIIKARNAWTPEQVRGARTAIDKLITASLTMSGLPPMPLAAEYIATVIAKCIQPCNWMQSSHAGLSGLDGKQLVSQQGDVAQAREIVSPERLFHMTCIYHEDQAKRLRTPTEEDLALQEEWQNGNEGKTPTR